MSSLNSWIGMGRLTAAPELRTTDTGLEVASFIIAIDRQTGKNKEKKTDFVSCTAWRQKAAFISKYFNKGDMIAVEGQLQSRKYEDKQGNKRIAWEIQVNQCHFCGGKSKANIDVDHETMSDMVPGSSYASTNQSDFEEIPNDDDLPF